MIDSSTVVEAAKQAANGPMGWGGGLVALATAVRIVWPIVDKIGAVALLFKRADKPPAMTYMTRDEHEKICSRLQLLNDQQFEELQDNRREIWKKIDQMYEWMVTGVIKINRQEGASK